MTIITGNDFVSGVQCIYVRFLQQERHIRNHKRSGKPLTRTKTRTMNSSAPQHPSHPQPYHHDGGRRRPRTIIYLLGLALLGLFFNAVSVTTSYLSWISMVRAPNAYINNNDDEEVFHNIDATRFNKTLALLYPPEILGGYRNQVIRLLSLCVKAHTSHIHNLLLESLYLRII